METTNKKQANPTLYALPRLGTSIFMGIADFSLLFLYASAYGLHPLLVGVALWSGKIAIAFFQFLFGWISDHTHTKWGRRKPYIFILAPILSISFIFLLLPGLILGASATKMDLFVWFLVFNIIFNASYGITTPYLSWMAELFTKDERPKASGIANIFNIIGSGLMGVFSLVVLTGVKDSLLVDPSNIPAELLYPTIIVGILLVIFFYITGFGMPVEDTPKYETNMIEDLRRVFRNKNFLLVTLMQGIASVAWSIIGSQLLIILDEVFVLSTTEYIIIAGTMLLITISGVMFWKRQIDKIGRKKTLLRIFLFGIIFTPFTLLGFIQFESYLLVGIFLIATITISFGGWQLFPYIMYADIAEEDKKKDGELKAGSFIGFSAIPLNIFQAFGLFFSTSILLLPDYQFGAGPGSIGLVLWGPICAVILAISLWFSKKFIKLDFSDEEKREK